MRYSRPSSTTRLEDQSEIIENLAERVLQLEAKAREFGDRTPSLGFSDDKLMLIATSMWRARLHRVNQFNVSLFGEPAWDMLLDLFVHKVSGLRLSTTTLCLGANVSVATGLRWIDRLHEEGLLVRHTTSDDKRLVLIEMTTKGYQLMRDYISSAVTRFKMPLPD